MTTQDLFDDATGVALVAPQRQRIIGFGKHKGKPFEVLLGDPEYGIWMLTAMYEKLRQQNPELFAFLLNRYGIPDSTPEHNRLQNRFLDNDFAIKFALAVSPRIREARDALSDVNLPRAWRNYVEGALRREWEHVDRLPKSFRDKDWGAGVRQRLEKEARSLEFFAGYGYRNRVQDSPPVAVESVEFEVKGADVFCIVSGYACLMAMAATERGDDVSIVQYSCRDGFRVEVKPFLGDDYPVVLRKMKEARSTHLLVDDFAAAGATWEEVVQVYARSSIVAVRLADVLATPIPECFIKPVVQPITTEMALTILAEVEHTVRSGAAAK